MKKLVLNFLILFYAWNASAQMPSKEILDSARTLVVNFWGQYNFDKFIFLDSSKSKVRSADPYEYVTFGNKYSFNPKYYEFHYEVKHPIFRHQKMKIIFNLVENGQIQILEPNQGLYQVDTLDKYKSIDKKEAERIAKIKGLPKGKRKWKTTLKWLPVEIVYGTNRDYSLKELVEGNITWAVESPMKEFQLECFRYSKVVAYIDLFNGKLIEIRNE